MRELRSHGVTLVEMLLVVMILGVVAVVAIPDFSSGDPARLDLAAEEFANAMRFARSEAIRTGEPRGFRQPNDTTRLMVFRPDTGTSPWTLIYDVYHPVSKQLYTVKLKNHPLAHADSVDKNFSYLSACNRQHAIYFDSSGIPRCVDPETVLLEQLDLKLTLGPHTRVVTLHGITGRVTVQ